MDDATRSLMVRADSTLFTGVKTTCAQSCMILSLRPACPAPCHTLLTLASLVFSMFFEHTRVTPALRLLYLFVLPECFSLG